MLTIPNDDLTDFARLPRSAQREVNWWLDIIERVNSATHKCAATQSLALAHGVSKQTISRKRASFKRIGWRSLINRSKNPIGGTTSLPKAFIDAWKTILKTHQRDTTGKEAHRKLISQWELWRSGDDNARIPGYLTPPAPTPTTGMPHGWSYDNLRKHGLTKHEKALERLGSTAAASFLPSVYTTRVGLKVGQVLMIDDQVYDNDVTWPGITQETFRPLGLNILDVFSGFDSTRGFKPVIRRDDGTRQMLSEKDTLWLVLSHLMEHGYREDTGTVIVAEHGTAAIRKVAAAALYQATGGKVTISVSGKQGRAVHGLVFEGQSRGNFKFKAARESWFNALRNRMAALPGATGLNRDRAPQEQYGINRYTKNLLKAGDSIPENLRDQLAFPILNWSLFLRVAGVCSEALNDRTDHALEGWEKANLLTHEWRLSHDQDWLPMDRLNLIQDANQRGAMEALIKAPGCHQIRRMSPREVYNSGRSELVKLTPFILNTIVPPEDALDATVNSKHEIILKNREIDPESLRYLSRVHTAANRTEILEAGTELKVYLNPFSPETILICDINHAAIGLAQREHPSCRLDEAGMIKQMGNVSQVRAELSLGARERAAGEATHRQALKAHNKALRNGLPTDPAEQRQLSATKAAGTRRSNSDSKAVEEAFASFADYREEEDDTPSISFD